MLELRPNCELCDKDLPPDAADARICSYECTFCAGASTTCCTMSARTAAEASSCARSDRSRPGETGPGSPTTRRATGDAGARTGAMRSPCSSSRFARFRRASASPRRLSGRARAPRTPGPGSRTPDRSSPPPAGGRRPADTSHGRSAGGGPPRRGPRAPPPVSSEPVERDARASSESVTTTPSKPSSPRRIPSMIGSDCDAMR